MVAPKLKTARPLLERPTTPALGMTVHLHAQERTRGGKWMRMKARVLEQAMGLCQCRRCALRLVPLPAHQVDHKRPLWAGGTDEWSNLQALNVDCHAAKSAHEEQLRTLGLPWTPYE